jgi:Uma2 family endonuclease
MAGEVWGDWPEPEWDVARLFPPRGAWSEEEYLALSTNRLVELSAGSLEVLPMPTQSHQLLVRFLFRLLSAFVDARALGTVLFAPFPVRLWAGKCREPDLLFMRAENAKRRHEQFWEGADLVVEVVSDSGRARDLEVKREEYARAGIPEYWVEDPLEKRILVLALERGDYRVHGDSGPGTQATSVLLPGFSADVDAVMASAAAPEGV